MGCQTDADTGFVLMGHRYFDPRIGRFITQDPAQSGGNWYAYAGNDPINAVDPSGLELQFSVPGNWTQAQVEAYTSLNYGDGTYSVKRQGEEPYTFTVQTHEPLSGVGFGWGPGLGVAGEFAHGTNNHHRNYGPTSTQARAFKESLGYRQVLQQILSGKKHGGVTTKRAFINTLKQFFTNGTQAQLGAFAWHFTNPNNSSKGIDITNDITFNSLAYHIPDGINKTYIEHGIFEYGDGSQYDLPLAWDSGEMGTIHQTIHLNYP